MVNLFPSKKKLHSMLMKQQWDKALKLLKTKAVGRQQVSQLDDTGLSPLTIAVMNKPPIEVVQLLLSICPSASRKLDCHQLTPLHVACRCGADAQVVRLLLQHDHGVTASFIDAQNKTPLHYCVEYICNPLEDVVVNMDTAQPAAVSFSGSKRKGVKVTARTKTATWDRSSPTEVKSKAVEAKELTMSMGQDELQDQTDIIHMLLSASPNTLWIPDVNSNIPIDYLHNCKADLVARSPKWERADIVSSILREFAVTLYRREKQMCERYSKAKADPLRILVRRKQHKPVPEDMCLDDNSMEIDNDDESDNIIQTPREIMQLDDYGDVSMYSVN